MGELTGIAMNIQNNRHFVLFVSGEKGLSFLNSFLANLDFKTLCSVISREVPGMHDDAYNEIIRLCLSLEIPCASSIAQLSEPITFESTIAIAAGWREMIRDPFEAILICHDSILPKYRGFNPLVTSLINGDEYIGASLIIANGEYDRGAIIKQVQHEISHPTSISQAIVMMSKMYSEIALFLSDSINLSKPLYFTPQDEDNASYSLWRDDEDYLIDWNEDSSTISRQILAMGKPYLGAKSCLNGRDIRITTAEIVEDVFIENRSPGKLIFLQDDGPVFVCGSGLLQIKEAFFDDGTSALPQISFRTRLN